MYLLQREPSARGWENINCSWAKVRSVSWESTASVPSKYIEWWWIQKLWLGNGRLLWSRCLSYCQTMKRETTAMCTIASERIVTRLTQWRAGTKTNMKVEFERTFNWRCLQWLISHIRLTGTNKAFFDTILGYLMKWCPTHGVIIWRMYRTRLIISSPYALSTSNLLECKKWAS